MAKNTRNTRALIRKAARGEFAKFGFSGARVARISRTAGVNKQLIFYYFDSKDGLFQAVMNGARDELTRAAKTAAGDGEHFRKSFEGLFHSLLASHELTRILLFGTSEDASQRNDILNHLARLLSESISLGQGLGHHRDDVDPDIVARQAVLLLVGYFAAGLPVLGKDALPAEWLKTTISMLNGWLTW